jgi:2-hydroxy-6-oxonona-2,4-dienedioate hydrolase
MSAAQAVGTMTDGKLERYREAERALWAEFGLEPRDHVVRVPELEAQVRVQEVGAGRPVIFVPGTGGIGPYWAPLVRELSGFRCLLVDRPGWGPSDPVDYRGRALADVSATVLGAVQQALDAPTVDVIGASIGGTWALGLAARRPSAVRRVVMIGGGPSRDVPIPGFFKVLASPLGAIIVRLPLSAKATASQIRAIGHGPSIDAGKMDRFIDWRITLTRETLSMRHERSMVKAYLGAGEWRPGFVPTDSELASVRQPVRMLFGSADNAGTPEVWKRFVDRLPNGSLEVVEGAGHMAWWDDPERIGRSVRRFLIDGE